MSQDVLTRKGTERRARIAVILGTVFALYTARMVQARPVAYVTNGGDGTVAVVDAGTTTHRENIRLCEFGDFCNLSGIAIAPDGRRAYVLSRETLFLIDIATNAIAGSLPFSGADIAFTPDGRQAFISNCGFGGAVCEFDTRHGAITAVISTPIHSGRVAVAPQVPIAYVTTSVDAGAGPGFIYVISTTSHRVTQAVGLDGPVWDVAFDPRRRRAYALANGALTVIDTSEHVVVRTVDLEAGPRRVGFAPDGGRAYVTAATDDSEQLIVIDTASDSVAARVILSSADLGNYGSRPLGVAVTPDGGRVYVVENEDYVVTAIDTQTLALIGSTNQIGEGPNEIAIADGPEGSVQDGSGCSLTRRHGDLLSSVILLLPLLVMGCPFRTRAKAGAADGPNPRLQATAAIAGSNESRGA